MSSLIYNNPYNNDISNSLIRLTKLKEYNNQPDIFNYSGGAYQQEGQRCIGGAYTSGDRLDEPQYFGKPSSGSKFIQPGITGQYPQYNMIELREINNDKLLEGGFSWGDVGSFLKPIVSKGLDIAAPALGTYLGGPLGATVANIGRDVLKSTTGYGRKIKPKMINIKAPKKTPKAPKAPKIPKPPKGPKKMKKNVEVEVEIKSEPSQNIGEYEGGKIKKARKTKTKINKLDSVSSSQEQQPLKTKKNRMELVKQIMKEKGLNLPAASSYIKQHQLY